METGEERESGYGNVRPATQPREGRMWIEWERERAFCLFSTSAEREREREPFIEGRRSETAVGYAKFGRRKGQQQQRLLIAPARK